MRGVIRVAAMVLAFAGPAAAQHWTPPKPGQDTCLGWDTLKAQATCRAHESAERAASRAHARRPLNAGAKPPEIRDAERLAAERATEAARVAAASKAGDEAHAAATAAAIPSRSASALWPPNDPHKEQARVAFSRSWAVAQRDALDFGALQRAAGADGRIESYALQVPFPHATYVWRGSGGSGRMQADLYEDGAFAAVISPADGTSAITVNSFGGFVCPACAPPIKSCGRRPSWIPHDVHWDVFDCESTLTGPMPETF